MTLTQALLPTTIFTPLKTLNITIIATAVSNYQVIPPPPVSTNNNITKKTTLPTDYNKYQKKCNKKEKKNYTNHKHTFNKHVNNYIATRKNITTITTSRCNSPKPHNNIKRNSMTKIKKRNLHQSTHITTTNNNTHLEENSELANYNVAISTSLNKPLDVRHSKNNNDKSTNKVKQLWKIFNKKHDSEKKQKTIGHLKEIPSKNESKNNLVQCSARQCSKQSRIRTNTTTNLKTMDILPTDDPT